MSTRDPREEARLAREHMQQQEILRKERAVQEKATQNHEEKKKNALTPGRPEFNTNPIKPEAFDTDRMVQEKFIKEQRDLYDQFMQFINRDQSVNASEKTQMKSDTSFNPKTGIITFSSVTSAAKFVAMKPEAALEAKCYDRSSAINAIREMNGKGILKNLSKLSYTDNGREQTLEGSELEAFKKKALPPRPTM